MSHRLDKRTCGILGLSLLGLALFGPGTYHLVQLSLLQRRLDRRLAELAAQHEQLTREHKRLQSDPTYVEGLIRTTFRLAQPGEYVIPLDSSESNGKAR
jgi:cell division protein FtsB